MKVRLFTALLMAFLVENAREAQAVPPNAPAPEVVVIASACPAVSADTMAGAVQTLTRVYRAFGVRIRVVAPGAEPLHGLVWRRLIIRPSSSSDFRPFGTSQVMGLSPRSGEARGLTGYIFFDVVVKTAERYAVPRGALLGYAMAHELGHLLLPTGAHGQSGVMRATWTLEDFGAIRKGSLMMDGREAQPVRAYVESLGVTP